MSAQTSMRHIWADADTKEQATHPLRAMVLSMSPAVTLFLRRVVIEPTFPIELNVPNAKTQAAMEESRTLVSTRRARFTSADKLLADLKKNNVQ